MVSDGTETYGRGGLDPFYGMSLERLPSMHVDECQLVACASNVKQEQPEYFGGPITVKLHYRFDEPLEAIASKCLSCGVTDRLVFSEIDDFNEMAVEGMKRAMTRCERKKTAETEADTGLMVTERSETDF
ncbi:MAG: hypothetical protein JWO47_245 [Candidatus Saccharibacteria bacterium]|nr:hypothetical protein [Candidatus Saccharibacteria bacterium]